MSVTMGDPPETEIVCPWCNGERVVVQTIAERRAAPDLVITVNRPKAEKKKQFHKPTVTHFRRERSCPRCGGRGEVLVDSKPPTAEELRAWEEMKG